MTASTRLSNANTSLQRKERKASTPLTVTGATPLSNEEVEQLDACEQVIETGIKVWYQVGEALLHIRDQRLYRAEYRTFEEYCINRWEMTRRSADRFISASEIAENLRPIGLIPANEAQARELTPYKPDEQRLIAKFVHAIVGDNPTAADYKTLGSIAITAANTGAIDNGEGEDIPLSEASVMHVKAAFTEETYERMQRQAAHIAEKAARKQRGKQEREINRSATPATLSGPLWQLLSGDFRTQMQTLDANSLDAIVTDPPYPQEYLPLYGALAHEAARVLKPGASLLVMCGQSYLPQIMSLMESSLTYHWTLAYLTPGGQSPQIWPRKVNTFWKPILWYVKGDYAGDWHGDVITSERNEKDAHHWQQSISGMADLIHKFTLPDQLILDPFCGSGTTGLACIGQSRRFIGIDCDESALSAARERLSHG